VISGINFVFNVVMLCRKNDYRLSFIKFCNLSFIDCFWNGCESWSLTLREERMLRVSENSPKKDDLTGEGRELHTRSFMICIPHPKLFG